MGLGAVNPRSEYVMQWWDKANDEQRRAGLHWYWKAHYLAQKMALSSGHSLDTAVGIIAALSPGTKWERNLLEAEALLHGRPITHTTYTPNVVKAKAIKLGNHPSKVLGGPKVTAFYKLIMDPSDSNTVCIDRHAVRTCTKYKWKSDVEASQWLRKGYDSCANAYRNVAKKLGLLPWQVQAVTWEVFRDGTGIR